MIRSVLLVVAALVTRGCSEPLNPPTPELLKGVRGKGGWWNGGCPDRPEDARIRGNTPEARSSELEARLGERFPLGSDAANIGPALVQLGFKPEPPCGNDQSIQRATFRQSGGSGLTGPYPMFATIAWRADAAGKVEWFKANVAYTGL